MNYIFFGCYSRSFKVYPLISHWLRASGDWWPLYSSIVADSRRWQTTWSNKRQDKDDGRNSFPESAQPTREGAIDGATDSNLKQTDSFTITVHFSVHFPVCTSILPLKLIAAVVQSRIDTNINETDSTVQMLCDLLHFLRWRGLPRQSKWFE